MVLGILAKITRHKTDRTFTEYQKQDEISISCFFYYRNELAMAPKNLSAKLKKLKAKMKKVS